MSSSALISDYLLNVSLEYKKKFKLAHINAQSLCDSAKYAEFCADFANSGIDVVAVSETWFKDYSVTNLTNYNATVVNRQDRTGGGIALYVKDCYRTRVLSSSTGESGKPEYVIVEILVGTVKALCACIYRPPNICHLDLFLDDLCNHLPNYSYAFVCGDVNGRFGSGESETQIVTDLFTTCNLDCIPYGPTYKPPQRNCKPSILDVIASNCPNLVLSYGQTPAPGYSAHDLLYAVFDLSTPRPSKKTLTYRNFKKLNSTALLDDARQVRWEEIFRLTDINNKVSLFNELLTELFDRHVPLQTITVKKQSEPWMTREILNLIEARNIVRQISLLTHDEDIIEMFRRLRNKVKQRIRNAKVQHFNSVFEGSSSTKEVWTAVKTLGAGKGKERAAPVVPLQDLNAHYASVSTVKYPEQVAETLPKYCHDGPQQPENSFHFRYALPQEIERAILSIKSGSKGVDMIPIRFIKLCLPVILPVLEHIFNYSLQNSSFPDVWKLANITPIAKVKNPSECKDYRPVSILCVLGKALEKIVHQQVSEFASINNILPSLQSGFRPGHSTTTALIKVTDDIRKAIDDRQLTLLVLLDLSKAFDCVHHELLLTKLRHLGFSDAVVRWFQSYLSDRFIRVFLSDDSMSDWEHVATGVPQGSVLGPLLFLLYLFDLPLFLKHCLFHLYADDVQLYFHFLPSQFPLALSYVAADVVSATAFMNGHNLTLNVGKTQAIVLGSQQYIKDFRASEAPPLIVNDVLVPYVNSVRNLGIIFDSTLSWTEHCMTVIKKVFGTLAQLRRTLSFIPTHVKKMLVQTLIFPRFDFALPLLTDLSATNELRLQRAQNACIRFIAGASRYEHITPFYKEFELLKLGERRKLLIAMLVCKISKFQHPLYLATQFKTVGNIKSRTTRSCNQGYVIPIHRTEKYHKSFHVQACYIWNELELHSLLSLSVPTIRHHVLKQIQTPMLYV